MIRHLWIHDLPFVYRMVAQGISFDSRLNLTTGSDSLGQAVLTGLGRVHPYVLRRGAESGYGVLHFPSGDQHAWLAYLAPSLENGASEALWLALIDGLTARAGAHGAVNLIAEVPETSSAFELLRRAGFATYERQEIWGRMPAPLEHEGRPRLAELPDEPAMLGLYSAVVPALIKQVEPPPTNAHQVYLIESRDSLQGMIAAYRGLRASLIEPYLRPQAQNRFDLALRRALADLGAEQRPVYCRLRHHALRWAPMLEDLNFVYLYSQAFMVRHTAARLTYGAGSQAPVIDNGSMPVISPAQDQRDRLAS